MSHVLVQRSKLGVFISLALVVALSAIYFIGRKQHLFGGSIRISGDFNDVSGVQVGNNVRFAGVNVGSVEAVNITQKDVVRVDMLISDKVRPFIHKDALASVGSESMMGNKVIVLSPGSDTEALVSNHDVIHAINPVSFDKVLAQIATASENAAQITNNLAQLSGTITKGEGAMGKIFMDKTFAREMFATLVNIRKTSAGLGDVLDAAQDSWLLWGSGGKKKIEEKKREREVFPSLEAPRSLQ